MSDDPAADAELRQVFHDEVMQRLDEMEAALLTAEAGEAGPEVIESLFRNAHTIKGSAAMFGLDDVSTVAHAAEDVLTVVRRSGSFPAELAAPLLNVTNVIRDLANGQPVPIDAVLAELTASQNAMTGGQASPHPEPPRPEPPRSEPPHPEPPSSPSHRIPSPPVPSHRAPSHRGKRGRMRASRRLAEPAVRRRRAGGGSAAPAAPAAPAARACRFGSPRRRSIICSTSLARRCRTRAGSRT